MENLLHIWRFRSFRNLWLVGLITSSARWLEILTFSVLAWQLTEDARAAGWMLAARMGALAMTGLLFSIYGHRIAGHRAMLAAHCGTGLSAMVAWILLKQDPLLALWGIGFVSAMSGMLWSVDFTFRRRMIGDSLPGDRVTTGVSLDVLSAHATRLVGPLMGGILLGHVGMDGILLLLVVLYIGSGLVFLHENDTGFSRSGQKGFVKAIGQVLQQAVNSPPILTVLTLTSLFNIFALPYLALISLIYLERFGMGEILAGILTSMEGIGAVLGGLLVSAFPPFRQVRFLILVLFSMWIFILGVGLVPLPWLVTIMTVAAGATSTGYAAMQSAIIYGASRPELRSPTFSLLTLSIGIGILGALNVSWMGGFLPVAGIVRILALEGLGLMAIFLVLGRYFMRRSRHPVVTEQTKNAGGSHD